MNRKPSTFLALALLAWASMSQSQHLTKPILQPGLPANQRVVVGSDVQFECKVLAGSQTHIQWLKILEVSGRRVGPDGLPYIRVLKSSHEDPQVLRLTNVSLDDAGVYTCLAGNIMGFAHQSATLTVLEDIQDIWKVQHSISFSRRL